MTNAEAARRYRERKAGRAAELAACSCCERQVRRLQSSLCSRCWAKTPDGKAATLERVRRHRAKTVHSDA